MLNIKMPFFLHWCQSASSINPYTNLHLQRPKTTISYPSPKPKIKVHLKICYAYRLREKSVFCWNTFYLNLLKKPWIATLLINCTHCNSIKKKKLHTLQRKDEFPLFDRGQNGKIKPLRPSNFLFDTFFVSLLFCSATPKEKRCIYMDPNVISKTRLEQLSKDA